MASSSQPDTFSEMDAATALLGIVMPAPVRAEAATKGQPPAGGVVQKVKIKRGPRGPYKPRKPKVLPLVPPRSPHSPRRPTRRRTHHRTVGPYRRCGTPQANLRRLAPCLKIYQGRGAEHQSAAGARQRFRVAACPQQVTRRPLPAAAAAAQQAAAAAAGAAAAAVRPPHAPMPAFHVPGAEMYPGTRECPPPGILPLPAQPAVPARISQGWPHRPLLAPLML